MIGFFIAGGILIALAFIAYNLHQTRVFVPNFVNFNCVKIIDELRISQITDFHQNYHVDLVKLVAELKEFNPDIICLTGDIDDCDKPKKQWITLNLVESLKELEKPIVMVLGNHEEGRSNIDKYLEELGKRQIEVLENRGYEAVIRGNKVKLQGVLHFNQKYDASIYDKDSYNILLCHSPKKAREIYTTEDLILTGHTHGGQVRLPLLGAIKAPSEEGFFPKYSKGIYELGDTKLYIDSGLGNTFLDLRFMCPIQYSNITIKPE